MTDRLVHECLLEGRRVGVFERSATVSSPSGMQLETTVETCYVCEAPSWPRVRLRARRGLPWLLAKLGRRRGLQLDDERFNARFRVDAEDEGFAIVLLSPGMQAFLLEKHVDWSTGPGELKLFYRGSLRRNRIEASLDRMRRFWSLVPPELLDEYEDYEPVAEP